MPRRPLTLKTRKGYYDDADVSADAVLPCLSRADVNNLENVVCDAAMAIADGTVLGS
jgi:hypothetical protein